VTNRGDHISDRELLLFVDGELAASRAQTVREHLGACESCRRRQADLGASIEEFDAGYREIDVPRAEAPRAALLKRLRRDEAQLELKHALWKAAAGVAAVLAIAIAWRVGSLSARSSDAAFAPRPNLTPGATRAVTREAVCTVSADHVELRRVASDVAEKVFRRYGIESPTPRTYEIDYLIPPDLGGSEDPRNLWPQPYARGVWNARVKDALEDRLRALVCTGKIDLATAQRDLARDWIGAYKRYFRTDKPLLDHVAFYKDSPWE
jgi:hypothetical protein